PGQTASSSAPCCGRCHAARLSRLATPRPPRSTLFPYTTLFRSRPRSRLNSHTPPGRGARRCHRARTRAPGASSVGGMVGREEGRDRKSTRLNSSHVKISYAVFCLKKKTHLRGHEAPPPTRDDIA